MINRKQACIKLRPPPVMVADFSVDEPPQTQAASTENPMEMIMKMADVGESQKGGIPPRKSVPADQRADHLDDLDIPAHPALYVTSSGSVSAHGNLTVNCNISLDPGSSGPSVSSVGPSGVGPSSVVLDHLMLQMLSGLILIQHGNNSTFLILCSMLHRSTLALLQYLHRSALPLLPCLRIQLCCCVSTSYG